MDELQARIRAIRSLQTDRNLAEQPYPEFDYPDDDQSQGEGNVVELPNRQAQFEPQSEQSKTPRSTSKRKQGTAPKRQSTGATAQKTVPFKQMRDGNQQPFIDELKRLEAQAERINQLLADRNRKKAQAEQSAEAVKGLSRTAKGGAPDESRTSSQKQRATRGAKQTQRSPQREVSPMPALDDDDTKDLEAQAERIKQLLADLETALLQGEAMPPGEAVIGKAGSGVSHTLNAPESTPAAMPTADIESLLSNPHHARSNVPPLPAQNQSSPLDVQKAQQEAVQTAQALRYLASRDVNRERIDPTIAEPIQEELRRGRSRSSRPTSGLFSIRRYGLRLRQFLQVPQKPIDKVGDALLWTVMAAVVRVGARVLLAMVPALAPVFMLLMFAPAALAVYLALFVPKAGLVSIYRLFLVTLGLVLGGML